MKKEQKDAISAISGELIAIKYELSLYVDDGLVRLGESLEGAIEKLNTVVGELEGNPAPSETDAEASGHSEVSGAVSESDQLSETDQSTGTEQEDEPEAPLVTTILPHRAASGILNTMRRQAAPEIIDLSSFNIQNLETFFPSERSFEHTRSEKRDNS